MFRAFAFAVSIALAASPLTAAQDRSATTTTTWTGWFSDRQCATPRVSRGVIGPNNPDCVKRCIDEGVTPVFISEQAKALFEVKDYPAVKDDVGYHVELTGIVDETAKSISVRSVKRLSDTGALCGLPKKGDGKR
jgi:hypothetical protein